jgi:type VI secretion system protein ImpF
VAGLTSQERLQPSLLDRLTDNEPGARSESPDARVLSKRQLRDAVLRDLSWLFNAVCEEPDARNTDRQRAEMWRDAPLAKESVLNFGIPPLSGQTISVLNFPAIEEQVRLAIVRFSTGLRPTSLRLSIKGQMWNQPVPLELLLSADVDVDTGQAAVRDMRT